MAKIMNKPFNLELRHIISWLPEIEQSGKYEFCSSNYKKGQEVDEELNGYITVFIDVTVKILHESKETICYPHYLKTITEINDIDICFYNNDDKRILHNNYKELERDIEKEII